VIPHYSLARRDLIRELHDAKKKVLVWTVNQSRAIRQFAAWDADGIISDQTKLLCQTVDIIPTRERSHIERGNKGKVKAEVDVDLK
jgi:hypothetical protein